jgi:hypothetical protein
MKQISLLALLLCCAFLSTAQMNYWDSPPYIINFSSGSVSYSNGLVFLTPPQLPPPPTDYFVSNGAFDSNGNLLFTVRNELVYDASGNVVGKLVDNWNTSTNPADNFATWSDLENEVAIVPVPGACKKFYVIYLKQDETLNYNIVDCSTGTVRVGYAATNEMEQVYSFNGEASIWGGIAVGKLQSGNVRYLYCVAGSKLNKFIISSTGIVLDQTLMNFSGYYDAATTELELSPDGRYLAWGNWYSVIHRVTLNTSGNFSSDVTISLPTLSRTSGLEFAPDNSLFASVNVLNSPSTSGLYFIPAPTAPQSTTATSFYTGDYDYTQLEAGKDGYIYGMSDAGVLNRIDVSTHTLTGLPFTITIPSHHAWGTLGNPYPYHLPDQIDGDNYNGKASFTINGATQVNVNVATEVTTCNPITLVNTSSSFSNPANYTISIRAVNSAGTYTPGNFSISYTYNNYTAASIDLRSIPVTNGTWLGNAADTGYYQVTWSTANGCGGNGTATSYIHVKSPAATAVGFNVNGQVQTSPTATPPTVWLCNGSTIVPLNATALGSVNSYTVTVKAGNWVNNAFVLTQGSTVSTTVNSTSLTLNTDLAALFPSFFTTYPTGFFQVTVVANATCNNANALPQVFNLQNVSQTVDFHMICNLYCAVGTYRPLQTTFPVPAWPGGADSYIQGWQGAGSCGVVGTSFSNSSNVLSSVLLVDELDALGDSVLNVVTYPVVGILGNSYTFNSIASPAGYFNMNYNTISNNKTYRVRVNANTSTCGTVTQSAYFKIAPTGAWNRMSQAEETSLENNRNSFRLYPSPAASSINMEWYNADEQQTHASISITDVNGKLIVNREATQVQGTNKQQFDLSGIASGIYFYKLSTGTETRTGKFEKH